MRHVNAWASGWQRRSCGRRGLTTGTDPFLALTIEHAATRLTEQEVRHRYEDGRKGLEVPRFFPD
jgi:hypothetical protein